MARLLTVVAELVLVALCIVAASSLAASYNIIPEAILTAKNAPLTGGDLRRVLLIGLPIHAVLFILFGALFGKGVFTDSRRTAQECYALIIAVSLLGSTVFVFTDISFSANYFAILTLVELAAFILAYVAVQALTGWRTAMAAAGRLVLSGLRLIYAPLGITAVAFASAPMALAIAYKLDNGFANSINTVRLYFNYSQEVRFHLVDAFPGLAFDQPIIAKAPPSGGDLPYVLERRGVLTRVVPARGGHAKETVLDISRRVGVVTMENGALGFAFHPEFGRPESKNRSFVFIYYTAADDRRQTNRLSRFDLAAGGPAEVAASEHVLIEQKRETYGWHNAGSVEFGPDGFLYMAVGDAKDPSVHQSISRRFYGGILRIDVDQRGGAVSHPPPRQPEGGKTQGYFIPNDNPFVGRPDVLEEFYALGLRNPFRIGFDAASGELWAGDVGDVRFEEINCIVPGGNYQWPFREGNAPSTNVEPPAAPIGRSMGPVYAYGQTAFERVVIGGFVYRGREHPDLAGRYIYADNFAGWISALDVAADQTKSPERLAQAGQVSQVGISSLTPTLDGGIYVTTLGKAGSGDGRLLRLARGPGQPEQVAALDASGGKEQATGPAEAKQAYLETCARCHGPDGRGEAVVEGVQMPDFTSAAWHAAISDEQLYRAITEGGAAVGKNAAMPPWGGVYSEAERRALVKVVRGFAGESAASDAHR